MRTVLGILASALLAGSAAAGTVDLSSYVNSDLSTYTSGEDYPSGLISIGGIDFDIAAFGNGAGVIQLSGEESREITVGHTGVSEAYVIVNSAWGTFGSNNGSLSFHGSGGAQLTVSLIQGVNIRDHWTSFNNFSSDIFATATYPGGNRFDVYRYDLSTLGGELTSVTFSATNAGFPQGAPFLAAITTDARGNPGSIPEPGTWGLMIFGFGVAGSALRGRRASRVQP